MKILVITLLLLWVLGVAVGFEGEMIHSLLIIAVLITLLELFSPSKGKSKNILRIK